MVFKELSKQNFKNWNNFKTSIFLILDNRGIGYFNEISSNLDKSEFTFHLFAFIFGQINTF